MAALAHFQCSDGEEDDSSSSAMNPDDAIPPVSADDAGAGTDEGGVVSASAAPREEQHEMQEAGHDQGSIATTEGSAAVAKAQSDTVGNAKKEAQLGRELFVFTAQKAGMKDVDKERVQKVVYDMSKDSKFFRNSIKQNQKVDLKIQEMRRQLTALSDKRRETMQKRVDEIVVQLEASRDLTRTIVVVDMDMFYAAVEMRDDPALRDVPLAVGGMSMICTTNYIARKFGVRAAMPGFIGKELCPELQFVPPNFEKYTVIATQIREIFAEYDPHFSAFSLDEARLDITEYMEVHWPKYCTRSGRIGEAEEEQKGGDYGYGDYSGDEDGDDEYYSKRMDENDRVYVASAVVDEIRRKICMKTELTASAGIAANTMLAKIASDMNKPNGQFVLPFTRESVVSFIQRQPVRKIGGIGKVMEKILAAIGITTGRDLFAHRAVLFHLFSDKTAPWLLRTSLAIQEVREATARKSFSRERTFQNLSDQDELEKMCARVCGYLAKDMQEAGVGTRNLTLKLKCADFSVRTRSVSFVTTIKPAKDDLYARAVEILRKELPLTLRLMGVRASSLVSLSSGRFTEDGGGHSGKRQLGIDHFARTMFTGGVRSAADATNSHDRQQDESAESASEDGGGPAEPAKAKRNKRVESMVNFVTTLSKESTLDIVATMLDANSVGGGGANRSASLVEIDATTLDSERNHDKHGAKSGEETHFDPASSFQPCPICGKMINVSNTIVINTHVDACIIKQSRSGKSNGNNSISSHLDTNRGTADAHGPRQSPIPSSSSSLWKSTTHFQPCPICGERINASNSKLVNTHIDACILSQPDGDNEPCATAGEAEANATIPAEELESAFQPCPICGHALDASDDSAVNLHIDACVQRRNQANSIGGATKRRRRGEPQHSIQSFFTRS